jgi:hypothetical protein
VVPIPVWAEAEPQQTIMRKMIRIDFIFYYNRRSIEMKLFVNP